MQCASSWTSASCLRFLRPASSLAAAKRLTCTRGSFGWALLCKSWGLLTNFPSPWRLSSGTRSPHFLICRHPSLSATRWSSLGSSWRESRWRVPPFLLSSSSSRRKWRFCWVDARRCAAYACSWLPPTWSWTAFPLSLAATQVSNSAATAAIATLAKLQPSCFKRV